MLFYGDPRYEEEFSTLLRYLHGCVKLSSGLDFSELEALERLRWLLIFAGQIQQGLEDAEDILAAETQQAGRIVWREAMQAVTERLADGFVALTAEACYDENAVREMPNGIVYAEEGKINVGATLNLLADTIPDSETAPPLPLTLKLPEGYAFYALYPEQYGASALQWAAEHAGETISSVRVIGIRSIGTSLAAVVHSALKLSGLNAAWQTVRPMGHPYERHATLGNLNIQPDEWALIVDEGPGQSGSSMASVAQALAEGGMARDRIAFLPGHGGSPGGSGNETVRQWWADTLRYVTPTDAMRWNGLAIPDLLAARTLPLVREYIEYRQHEGNECELECGEDVGVAFVEDFGGGLWRRAVYADETQWPAVCAAFERPKIRVTLSNGIRVLWKYAGLATIPLPNPPTSPTSKREGWLSQSHVMELWLQLRGAIATPVPPAPLGSAMGFVAMLWREGTPLTRADLTPTFLTEMGSYIGACSAPPSTPEEHEASLARLQSLLYWNTWEALGEEAAEQTRQWSAMLEQSDWARQARAFGDGHLAPHEWIRTPSGQIHKTDSIGYEPDHTLVGRQAYVWDIAGAFVEWQLEAATVAPLLEAAQEAIQHLTPKAASLNSTIPPDILPAYQMAYAAFRAGQTHLCANMSAYDPAEQARLWKAYNFYKETLARLLQI